MVETALKTHASPGTFSPSSSRSWPGRSRRERPCSFSAGSGSGRRTASSSSPRPTWSSRCATSLEAEVERRGRGGRSGPAAARHRAVAARRRRLDRARRRRVGVSRSPAARRATGSTPTRRRTSRSCPRSTRIALQTVDRDALVETIERVGRSASRDESRPGADGHPRPLRAGQDRDGRDRLVPARGEGDAARGLAARARGDHPGPRAAGAVARSAATAPSCSSACTRTTSSSARDGAWLTTRRIDGQFPNYRQLLPEQFEHELELPREELLDVVRRVSVMAQRNSPLRLRFADGELTVSAQTQDVGEARESLPAAYAADAMEIGFNADFLRDGLESVDSPTRHDQADQPAPAGRARGRDRRLHVPDHADPARRLIVADVTLRNYRSYAALDLGLSPGHRARRRRERRRQDEPARGAPPRHAGLLAADARRGPARPLRRAGRARRARRLPRRRRATTSGCKLSAGAAKVAELDGARLPSAECLRREFATLVFTPDRLAVVKGGPAARRAYFDRAGGRLHPARLAVPQDYAAALAQRNAALRRLQLGLSAATRSRRGASASRSSARRSSSCGARRSPRSRPVFAERAGGARPRRRAARRTTASRRLRPTLEARLDRDVARGVDRARPAPRRRRDRRRRAATCGASARRASSGSPCSRSCSPRRSCCRASRCCSSTTSSRSSTPPPPRARATASPSSARS